MVGRGQQTAVLSALMKERGVIAGRFEERSWDRSLPALVDALADLPIKKHQVVLECPMPGASTRADVVLLGEEPDGRRRVVVLELKQWPSAEGAGPEMVTWGASQHLHPSSQVQGYRDYLSLYSAALVDRTPESEVHGAAFLHDMQDVGPLAHGVDAAALQRNQALVKDCPAFGRKQNEALAEWIKQRIGGIPSPAFVAEFTAGERKQSKKVAQNLRQVFMGGRSPWVLVDIQREVMVQTIEPLLRRVAEEKVRGEQRRHVVLVTGGPGTGKTAVAMTAMLEAQANHALQAAFVSTSSAQHEALLGDLQLTAGGQLAPTRKQTTFPLVKPSVMRVRADIVEAYKRAPANLRTPEKWQAHCEAWHDVPKYREAMSSPPAYDVIVCDEAQGLVDGLKPYVDGSNANSWRKPWGPQAWHLMAQARLCIFFMDADQGYRQVESTTPADIRSLAEKDALDLQETSLGGGQFRLRGGVEFTQWLDWLLGLSAAQTATGFLSTDEVERLRTVFSVVDDPGSMRDRLRGLHGREGNRCRLLAGYAWGWSSKKDTMRIDSADGLGTLGRQPPPGLAFRWATGGEEGQRDFNLGTGRCADPNYLFGSGTDLPAIAGYPLTVRGRDLDHVGVLWGADLVRRGGEWVAVASHVFGTDMPQVRKAASDEAAKGTIHGVGSRTLVRALAGAYRILLTRGMSSVQVWIEDPETARFVRDSWATFLANAQRAS